jgi:chemotaxis protein MotB
MPKQTWIVASILSALVILAFAVLSLAGKFREVEALTAELEAARQSAAAAEAERDALETANAVAKEQLAALMAEKQAVEQKQSTLEQQMRAAIESKDVTISELQGRLTVNIVDRILFDSGEAEVRGEGLDVLRQIAEILTKFPDRQIHVTGHTDNVPITGSLARRYPTNWELSAARALAAVRFLAEQAGVDVRRLAAVGYGEFHPIADNATPEGRAKNRRIEIVVLPEELASVPRPPVPPEPVRAEPVPAPAPVVPAEPQ